MGNDLSSTGVLEADVEGRPIEEGEEDDSSLYQALLNDLCGSIPIAPDSSFWRNNLLDIRMLVEVWEMEVSVQAWIEDSTPHLIQNAELSGNLQSMMTAVAFYLESLPKDTKAPPAWLTNLLYFTRCYIMYVTGYASYDQRQRIFSLPAPPFHGAAEEKLATTPTVLPQADVSLQILQEDVPELEEEEEDKSFWNSLPPMEDSQTAQIKDVGLRLVYAVTKVLVETQVITAEELQNGEDTGTEMLELHTECVNTLLVLLCSQIYGPLVANYENPFLDRMLKPAPYGGDSKILREPELMAALLARIGDGAHVNFDDAASEEQLAAQRSKQGLFRKLTNSVMWMIRLPYDMITYLFQDISQTMRQTEMLASRSALLLMLLTHQRPVTPTEGKVNTYSRTPNAYFLALSTMQNSDMLDVKSKDVTASFNDLYKSIVRSLPEEWAVLLLYTLLQKCNGFKEFIFSKSDVDVLVLPLLKIIYKQGRKNLNGNHVYMINVVLLFLSPDNSFGKSVFERFQTEDVHWFEGFPQGAVSIGSLIVSVLLRAVKFDILDTSLQQPYSSSTCLAILANLCQHATNLAEHSAKSFIDTLQVMTKKLQLLNQKEQKDETDSDDARVKIQQLSELMRLFIEVINATVFTKPAKETENILLIYWLLYRNDIIVDLQKDDVFADLLTGISALLNHERLHVEAEAKKHGQINTNDVTLEAMCSGMLSKELPVEVQQANDKQKNADKFTYEEQTNDHEFFLPYIWSMTHNMDALTWYTDPIILFDLEAVDGDSESEEDATYEQQEEEGHAPIPQSGDQIV